MERRFVGMLAGALVALAAAGAAGGSRPSALGVTLQDELERIDAKLAVLVAAARPGSPPPQVAQLRDGLTHVRSAASPTLRLYRLHHLFVDLETFSYVAANRRAASSSEGFSRLWAVEAPRFKGAAKAAGSVARGGALLVALVDAAQNHGEKLYAAAPPYARATSPASGVYYLGQALAELRFRDLVVALAAAAPPRTEVRPGKTPLTAALDATEGSMLAAFARDRASPAMIQVSALLKEARELAARDEREAAALTLFDARFALAMAPPAGKEQSAARRAAAPPGPDGSLSALLHALATDPSADAAIRRIAADDVLPLYDNLFGSN